jgi:hypothetical protein
MAIEAYDHNAGSSETLKSTYSDVEFPDLVMVYAGYQGEDNEFPHRAQHGLTMALELTNRKPCPTIIIFGFIPMSQWNTDERILELRRIERVHFIEAPLDIFAVTNAWRIDHGQPPLPDLAPWLPQNSLRNPRAKDSRTKNP